MTYLFFFSLIYQSMATTDVLVGLIADTRMPNVRKAMDEAINELNPKESTTPIPFRFSYKNDESSTCADGPDMERGVFALGDFYVNSNLKAVFGPTCFRDLEIAARLTNDWDILQFNFWTDHPSDYLSNSIVQMTASSTTNMAENIFAFLRGADWTKVALVSCEDCYPAKENKDTVDKVQNITRYLKMNGVQVVYTAVVNQNTPMESYMQKLGGLSKEARVVLPFLGPTLANYVNLQLAMRNLNLSSDDYSTLIVLADFQLGGIQVPWTGDATIQEAFEKCVVLYNDMNTDAANSVRVTEFIKRVDVGTTFAQTYIQLYESVFVLNSLLTTASGTTGDVKNYSAKAMLQNTIGDIKGPFGSILFNKDVHRISPYLVYLITNGTMMKIGDIKAGTASDDKVPCAQTQGQCLKYDPDKGILNAGQPTCGFYGELCDQTGTVIIIAAVMSTVFVSVGLFIGIKRIRSSRRGGEQSSMPWVVPFSSIRLIDLKQPPPANQLSILSLQRHMEDAVKQRQFMSESRQLATWNQQYVVVDRYAQREKISFDKADIQLLFAIKQLQHDNVNAFLGMSFDKSTHLFVLWSHCFRGSLSEWIFVKKNQRSSFAEKNFREAFVRDILKGLDYLHSSPISYHGSLTPSQCYIDTHWILKVSGFGVTRLLSRWKNGNVIATVDGKPLIPNHELHYYAPEVRKKLKSLMYTNRTELLTLTAKEGQAADMYAFGVVLFEILHKKKMVDIDDYMRNEPEEDGLILCEQAEALVPTQTPAEDDIDKDVHNDLKSLMLNCWNTNLELRPDGTMARKITDATLKMSGSLVDQMLRNMEMYTLGLETLVKDRTAQLEEAQQKADGLLSEMLPKSIADDLKKGIQIDARHYKSVTIMYSDIVGFTSLCSESLPMEVVTLLSQLFDKFDSIITKHDGFKMETIGDAYCVASGIPIENKLRHVANIANIALKQRKFMTEFEIPHRPGQYLHCRWGFNTGPLFSGVIGRRAPRYAAFGQAVVIAAKMENLGIPDKIQMTFDSYKLLTTHHPEFICSPREGGAVSVPGVGYLLTYWLDGVEDLLRTDREVFDRALEEHEKKEEDPYSFPRKTPNTVSSASNVTPRFKAETSL